MIDRFPEGTPEIPYPHKVYRWKDGSVTMTVELDPHMRGNPPKIDGWAPFFVGFHGYDQPMTYSYRPQPVPTRPMNRRKVAKLSPVVFAMGCCVEDRGNLTDDQLDLMWAHLAENIDGLWERVGPVIDSIEDEIAGIRVTTV